MIPKLRWIGQTYRISPTIPQVRPNLQDSDRQFQRFAQTFTTSGFTAVSLIRTPAQPLTVAGFRSIDRGPNSGQAVVKVQSQTGVIAFDVHYALEGSGGALAPWTTLTLTSSKKVIISGLTPAGTYQFQVRALGKLGYTDWSASMTFISA